MDIERGRQVRRVVHLSNELVGDDEELFLPVRLF
jgi:hypothetical protein